MIPIFHMDSLTNQNHKRAPHILSYNGNSGARTSATEMISKKFWPSGTAEVIVFNVPIGQTTKNVMSNRYELTKTVKYVHYVIFKIVRTEASRGYLFFHLTFFWFILMNILVRSKSILWTFLAWRFVVSGNCVNSIVARKSGRGTDHQHIVSRHIKKGVLLKCSFFFRENK